MKRAFVVSVILLIVMACQPHSLLADSGRTIEKSFPVKMGGKLVLDIDTGGDVEIAGWDKAEIAATVRIDGDDADRVNVAFEPGSSLLRIHSECEKHHHVDIDLHFTIKVPAKCDVEIDSKGGEVSIQGVEGELSGKTMGGALELARVKGGIRLETMGGDVKVEDSEANGMVSTMGGEVTIRNVKGNLKGHTMGGSVTYDNVTGRSASSGNDDVHISTMGGDIKINKTEGKVSAKTMGGDIDVSKAEAVHVTTMGGDINVDEAPAGATVTTMGGDVTIHSAGKYVKAKTMGGSIEVDAVDGGADATTMGGDITVTMVGDPKKGDREVNLSSMGGDVTLMVPEGLSMKFDLEIKYTKKHHGDCRIESDFPMDIKESPDWEHSFWGEPCKHIYGTGSVAGGEHLIKIRTVNGKITIKRAA
ncbi:MAG: hypothetical protein ABR899_10890 [Candidatus Krumholzibacteriaceae bacterium]|jgi:DUF4097 and DUF4098 domain-containing protein YvlB